MKLKSRAARRGNWKIYSQLVGNSVPTICLPFENYFCHYLNVSLDSNINCNPLDNVNEKWIEKFIRWAWLDMFDGKWIEDNFDLYIYISRSWKAKYVERHKVSQMLIRLRKFGLELKWIIHPLHQPLLLSCRKLQLCSVIPSYLNLAQYHLTIYDR